MFCRHCSVSCVDCQDDADGLHCKECQPGHLFSPGSDICLNFSATGFKEVSGETTAHESSDENYDGLVASFTFTGANSANSYWTSSHSVDGFMAHGGRRL